MQAIRAVAVGLIMAAVLMIESAKVFFTYWQNDDPFFLRTLAINSISPKTIEMSGANEVGIAVFVSFCLGLGFLISATIYVKIETVICRVNEAFRLRNEQTDYAKQMRQQYLAWLSKRWA